MSGITTHVLDTARGQPARGVAVVLEAVHDGTRREGRTDADGRVRDLLPAGAPLQPGDYRLTFHTGDYFRDQGIAPFYPEVTVLFTIRDTGGHYHVPLLLSPYGYSTYRGS